MSRTCVCERESLFKTGVSMYAFERLSKEEKVGLCEAVQRQKYSCLHCLSYSSVSSEVEERAARCSPNNWYQCEKILEAYGNGGVVPLETAVVAADSIGGGFRARRSLLAV